MSSAGGIGVGGTAGTTGHKGPYAPTTQTLGNPPHPIPDVPATAVFLFLFLVAGICNQTLFIRNKKAGHKFVFSGAMFGFSTIRVCSAALRIAWAYHPESVNVAIAAQIFVAAGTVILYIVNLFLAQRLFRARHPQVGWTKPFSLFMGPVVIGITFIALIMIIVTVIQTFFTLNNDIHRIDHSILLFGVTEFAVASFIPVLAILVMLIMPRRTYIDKFGNGKFKTKVGIALTGSILVCLGSAFRCGTSWLPTAFIGEPEKWYFSKACFYVFDYGIDVVVLYLYLISRVDKRFYIPDGAQGAGAYAGDVLAEDIPPSWDFEAYMRSHNHFEGDETTLDDGRSTMASTKAPSYLEMDTRSGKWNIRDSSHVSLGDTLHDQPGRSNHHRHGSGAPSRASAVPSRASRAVTYVTDDER